jgi:hypothetical protein
MGVWNADDRRRFFQVLNDASTGRVSDYGCKISWTEAGKAQTTFSLIVEEPGKEGTTFKTFVPVLIIGSQAEAMAERLEAGGYVMISGKLAYKAGKTKEAGKLHVVCFGVEILATSPTEAAV